MPETKTTKLLTENLKLGVNIANRFVPLRPSLPALGNLLLESQKGKIQISSTNLESSVQLSQASSGEDWATTVPAKVFVELVNSLKDKETALNLDKETLELSSGSTKATFNTLAASEFPQIAKVETKNNKDTVQKSLQEAIGKVAFAASSEETKPVLGGILLRSKGEETLLVTTDSYRLAIATLKENLGLDDLLIPARGFAEALKIAGELEEETISLVSSAENNQLLISGSSFQIASRLIDGVYPNYEQIIPSDFVTTLRANREELLSALKTAAVLARDIGNVVRLNLKSGKSTTIEADTAQIGSASTSLDAEVDGEELQVAFNSNFLLDGLAALKDEEVEIRFAGSLKPAVLENKNKDFKYIAMPVRSQR